MVDDTSRPIELMAGGDLVLGRDGQANRVSGVERPIPGGRAGGIGTAANTEPRRPLLAAEPDLGATAQNRPPT